MDRKNPQSLSSQQLKKKKSSLSQLGSSIVTSRVPGNLNDLTLAQDTQKDDLFQTGSRLITSQSLSNVKFFSFIPSMLDQPLVTMAIQSDGEEFKQNEPVVMPPPPEKQMAVFAIYTLGYNIASRNYGRANGAGILLNENLCITTHGVVPDEYTASNSYAQFRDGSIHKFNVELCFYTSPKYELSLIAFQKSASLKMIQGIHATETFDLQLNDRVSRLPFRSLRKETVLRIEKDSFNFSSGKKEEIMVGSPIFNIEWGLQGIFVRSSSHMNQAIRLGPFLSFLDTSLNVNHNVLIEKFLHEDHIAYLEKSHGGHIKFFEWHSQNVWNYDIDREVWEMITIDDKEIGMEWSFNWSHRLVYLTSGSILIIGGRSQITGNESDQVLEFTDGYIKLAPHLIVPRESPTCLTVKDSVYALGGRNTPRSCEMFSLEHQKWFRVADMINERPEGTACTALESRFIFIFGGKKIEKYSIELNYWQEIPIEFPVPLHRLGIYPITNKMIAIFGGSSTDAIYTLKIGYQYQGRAMKEQGHRFTLETSKAKLSQNLETVHPCIFSRNYNKIMFLNMLKSHHYTPTVVEISLDSLIV